jgi:hypothetical protein
VSVTLAPPPHILNVDPNSRAFRRALRTAGLILTGTPFSVYSRHEHYAMPDGMVLFEEQVLPGELAAEAAERGLPSCWGVASDGSVVVLRYADKALHRASGIGVTDAGFLAMLADAAARFAVARLHETLELNIAGHLFPPGNGMVTFEVTNEEARLQRVTVAPVPAEVIDGDWNTVACWGFTAEGEPVVTGICSNGNDVSVHE